MQECFISLRNSISKIIHQDNFSISMVYDKLLLSKTLNEKEKLNSNSYVKYKNINRIEIILRSYKTINITVSRMV